MRVAFSLIGGRDWMGGYNYLLNLITVLKEHAVERVQPVLFVGTEVDSMLSNPFEKIGGVSVVRSAVFNRNCEYRRLAMALIRGCDTEAIRVFEKEKINVIFESAKFYGWSLPIPAVAWFPDLQHRCLRHLFGFKSYWKREIGFQAQVLSGRYIMLSSEDARKDCERFYSRSRGVTHVVRFSIPNRLNINTVDARKIADYYGLPEFFFFLPNQFWKHKNHACVIRALNILKDRGQNFVIAASGRQFDPRHPDYFLGLKSDIINQGIEKNFRLLGLIPHDHLIGLMKSCVAIINPSTFEGWSTTVEEAKSIGTPMILSALAVHREQCKDALFFDGGSPYQLAQILSGYDYQRSIVVKRELSRELESDSSGVKEFANQFADLMELADRRTI